MNPAKTGRRSSIAKSKLVIRTTFLDLVGRLAELTKDDAALVASVRRVLEGCNVRLVHSMAPVRVGAGKTKAIRRRKHHTNRPAWA